MSAHGSTSPLPSRPDLEATLTELLSRFAASDDHSAAQVQRFAAAGAEALLTELQSRVWLDRADTAAALGVSEADVQQQIAAHALPAAKDDQGQPHVHRRDLSLQRLSMRLGATEGQHTPLTTPIAWSEELSSSGFSPWDGITPG